MNFKKIQKITLFAVLIGVSIPAQAFWGQETLSRWTANVISYVQDLYSQPTEHKTALGVGAAATTIAAVLAYNYWPKKDDGSAVPAVLARRASITGQSPVVLNELVSDKESGSQRQANEIPAADQPGTRRVSAQSTNQPDMSGSWTMADFRGISDVEHLKTELAKYGFNSAEQEQVLIGAYVQYVLTHQAENQSVFERLQKSAYRKNFVRDLIWYWEALARMRRQKFTEGTYVIHDPSKKLYDFITYFGYGGDLYKRPSSHFDVYAAVYNKELKQSMPNMTQAGFDLSYPLLNKTQLGFDFDDRDLPDKKGTLLIGKLKYDESLFFVKPENYSCKIAPQSLSSSAVSKVASDTAMHGCEFVVAQVRKKAQKLIDSPVKEWLHEYLGFDDDPDWRKERVPSDLIKQYQSLLQKTRICESEQDKLLLEAAAYGIQRMALHAYTTLRELGDDPDLEAFKQQLQNYDYVGLRFGREVIIATDQPGLRMMYNHLLKNPQLMNNKSEEDVKKYYKWASQLLLPDQVALGIRAIDPNVSNELIQQGGPPAYKDMLNVQDAQHIFEYLHEHNLL